MAKKDHTNRSKPRVVFDPKMPRYEYRDSGGHSLSVDRKRVAPKTLPPDTLAHLKAS